MEFDDNKQVNNVLDLYDDTKLLSPDIKLLRRDINMIRDELKDLNTEVYVHKDKDMVCIIRMIVDEKDLINNKLMKESKHNSFDFGEIYFNKNIDTNYYEQFNIPNQNDINNINAQTYDHNDKNFNTLKKRKKNYETQNSNYIYLFLNINFKYIK